jgi:hypothetical protein
MRPEASNQGKNKQHDCLPNEDLSACHCRPRNAPTPNAAATRATIKNIEAQ